jgi:hypothetical protein
MNKQRVPIRSLFPVLILLAGAAQAGLDDLLKSAGDLVAPGSTGGGEATSISGSLTNSQIDAGLKQALSVGAERAVALLGQPGGFLDDRAVRIGLPSSLEPVATGLRAAGQGKYVDEFELAVNRAAEEAVPATLDIVKRTVEGMTLDDVRGILAGGDDAATRFLQQSAGDEMRDAVLPIVARATDSAGVTSAYKAMTDRAGGAIGGVGGSLGGGLGGLLGSSDALDLDRYVTDKAMDGLFAKLALEEKQIRENPVARSTDLLKTVFGGR